MTVVRGNARMIPAALVVQIDHAEGVRAWTGKCVPVFTGGWVATRARWHYVLCSKLELIRMPVNLSIKNAPDDIVERLRERASKHHRSLQGELLAIIEDAVRPPARLTAGDVLAEVRRLALETPAEAAAIIRADRDDR